MKYIAVFVFFSTVCACADAQSDSTGTYGAQVGIVNHTGRYIYATMVGDSGGGHSDKYNPGVANICCVTLPDKWNPKLEFLVRWDMPEGTKHVWREKLVKVQQYDKPGSLYLHFFQDDEVRIVVTNWAGSSPKHPIAPPPEAE
ncbi:hypothetical protein GCM10007387_58440 [Pseudoduganella albidiflava]|nr:hypothetical protein GCM10007387_58440 [Pseudoduganella albidiflava]